MGADGSAMRGLGPPDEGPHPAHGVAFSSAYALSPEAARWLPTSLVDPLAVQVVADGKTAISAEHALAHTFLAEQHDPDAEPIKGL